MRHVRMCCWQPQAAGVGFGHEYKALDDDVLSDCAAAPHPGVRRRTLASDADDPILGVWKLNLARSKCIPGPPPRSQTRTYRLKDDEIFVTIETVDAHGERQPTIEFPERYDGK